MGMRAGWVPQVRDTAVVVGAALEAAKTNEPVTPVTVLVASNHAGVASPQLQALGVLGGVRSRGVALIHISFVTSNRTANLRGGRRQAVTRRSWAARHRPALGPL
jgi:hypothetical protein